MLSYHLSSAPLCLDFSSFLTWTLLFAYILGGWSHSSLSHRLSICPAPCVWDFIFVFGPAVFLTTTFQEPALNATHPTVNQAGKVGLLAISFVKYKTSNANPDCGLSFSQCSVKLIWSTWWTFWKNLHLPFETQSIFSCFSPTWLVVLTQFLLLVTPFPLNPCRKIVGLNNWSSSI